MKNSPRTNNVNRGDVIECTLIDRLMGSINVNTNNVSKNTDRQILLQVSGDYIRGRTWNEKQTLSPVEGFVMTQAHLQTNMMK